MRIIAGQFRGREVKAVPSKQTRPTLDQVKESMFNALGQFFDGGDALDLYAGSGNLGFEALSRGVDHVTFVDRSHQAIQTIKENIERLNVGHASTVLKMDAFVALKYFIDKGASFDYIFIDPPYGKQAIVPVIEQISLFGLLKDEGRLICEVARGVDAPDAIGRIRRLKDYRFGQTTVIMYEKEGETNE